MVKGYAPLPICVFAGITKSVSTFIYTSLQVHAETKKYFTFSNFYFVGSKNPMSNMMTQDAEPQVVETIRVTQSPLQLM